MTREEVRALDNEHLDHRLDMELDGIDWKRIDRPFSTDFNAIQAAEKTLMPEQWGKYLNILLCNMAEISQERVDHLGGLMVDMKVLLGGLYALAATPRQRAEALLLALTEPEGEKSHGLESQSN